MPISFFQDETRCVIRLGGDAGLAEATDLKRSLIDGLATGGKLHLDLADAAEIDITVIQLLHAALRQAERSGTRISMRVSAAAESAMKGAGFDLCSSATVWDD